MCFKLRLVWVFVWIVAGPRPGKSCELLVQKGQGFLVQIAFPRWFLECAYQVFDEMSVMT
jgi:hypothetical protein